MYLSEYKLIPELYRLRHACDKVSEFTTSNRLVVISCMNTPDISRLQCSKLIDPQDS